MEEFRMADDKAKKDVGDDEPHAGTAPSETGMGAAFDASAKGAMMGAAAGPVSAIVGAAAGVIVGVLSGNRIAESIDPAIEIEHWRESFPTRDYYDPNLPFTDFEPAYRLALENFRSDCRFEDLENVLRSQWNAEQADNRLSWFVAKLAMQDAWHQLKGQSRRSDESYKMPR